MLISKAFTPQIIAKIEPLIREFSRSLLVPFRGHSTFDLASDFAVPLAMKVIAHMIGIPGEGRHLTQAEILGFFQLLVVGGQKTTANLIDNAVLSLLENPSQHAILRNHMRLLPSAIEETLRYRAPIQWVMPTPTRNIEMHGRTLSPGQLILAVIGSANRDSKHFDAMLAESEAPSYADKSVGCEISSFSPLTLTLRDAGE